MDHQGYMAVPTFDYSSAFNYRSVLSEDFDSFLDGDHFDTGTESRISKDRSQLLAYYLLTTLSFIFFLVTVPISSFFCVKKVHSLQRCLTYRLGNRLPLKGPGYILKLPFIDHISIIDLYEDRFSIIDTEEQILTSDGSIISMRPCQASLNVTNAVLTTLKIGEVNVKQCLRLRFGNVIRSKHVEDLENKMDFVVKQFEENCNKFLLRWGYSFKLDEIPRFTVIERADPINPIKTKLTKLLNPEEGEKPSSPAEALLNLLGPMMPNMENCLANPTPAPKQVDNQQHQPPSGIPLTDFELARTIPVLQSFIEQYKSYLAGYTCLAIELRISDQSEAMQRHHYFQYSEESIKSLVLPPPRVDFRVRFESYANYERFLVSKDVQYVQYSFN